MTNGWIRIGNCVAGFHRLQYKHKCKSVLIYRTDAD
uniref:Uncharacterized protein n=1 Tax=Siphoviridae sp. ctYaH2 TaxID=2825549 RepID=A0A8S5V5K1_9CAUD|nr:MAG TPA: hypothetical protein [Siphoviridae sp. ctYaH2]